MPLYSQQQHKTGSGRNGGLPSYKNMGSKLEMFHPVQLMGLLGQCMREVHLQETVCAMRCGRLREWG